MTDDTVFLYFQSSQDCEQLNDLMFAEFVYENGEYKFPFAAGTDRYCPCSPNPNNATCLSVLDDNMVEFAGRNPAVAELISNQITYADAVAAGWFAEE